MDSPEYPSWHGKISWRWAVSRILSSPETGGGDHLSERSNPELFPTDRKRDGPPLEFPIWPCTGWGLPCPFNCSPGGGLLPHLFTLTAPKDGGFFSAALSVGPVLELILPCVPPTGVTRHPALRSSDFPPGGSPRRATSRPHATPTILTPARIEQTFTITEFQVEW